MRLSTSFKGLLSITIVAPLYAFASEYPKGHHALEIFDAEGIEATPFGVMVWIVVSTACFLAGLFFIRRHAIARWVVGCYVAGFMFLVFLSVFSLVQLQLAGFLSLNHLIFWSPAFYQLITKRPFMARQITAFSIWSGIITGVMLISFAFDVPYAFIFLNHILLEL